jgi:hypothetical protein
MADWRDVMDARAEADSALGAFDRLIEQADQSSLAEATALVGLTMQALCLELRALGTLLDYALYKPIEREM